MKTELIEKLEKLPAALEKEVEDFVDFLIYKDQQKEKNIDSKFVDEGSISFDVINDSNGLYNQGPKRKREFGGLKGKIWMSDDFDEPLEEKSKLKREFGGLKGLVTYMADDFDAPLEDFKDYM